MNSQAEHISLRFYDYLCKVIGTEEVVQARRRILNALDYIQDNQFISTGSKAEGLDIKGSDFDAMCIFQIYTVCEDLSTLENLKFSELVLVMDTTDTKPGFTRLKLIPEGCLYGPIIYNQCDYENGTTYLSSKKFRELAVEFFSEYKVHGPCITWGDGSYEYANSLFCKHWITDASDWIFRSRTHWPANRTVNAVVDSGTLFVPIGKKGSKYEDLEFRISFSVAEKLLIHSFNHVQLFCYALMKIVLKDILRKVHGEIICSYFIKTIMFWICEETNPSLWTPDRLLQCFINCFRRLLYCVHHETCLHYFIPENDLFEGRFKFNEQKELLVTLKSLLVSDWRLLLQTETLKSFHNTLTPSNFCFIPFSSALPFLIFLERTFLPPLLDWRIRFRSCLKIRTRETRIMSVLNLNGLIMKDLSLYLSKVGDMNKHFYKLYRKCMCHLLIGTYNDAISWWLLVASLFYRCNRYGNCTQILNFCLQQLTPDKIVLDPPVSEGSEHLLNEKIQDAKRLKRQQSFTMARKLYTVQTVRIPFDSFLLPQELLHVAGLSNNELLFGMPMVSSVQFVQVLYQFCQRRCVSGNKDTIPDDIPFASVKALKPSAGNGFIL